MGSIRKGYVVRRRKLSKATRAQSLFFTKGTCHQDASVKFGVTGTDLTR